MPSTCHSCSLCLPPQEVDAQMLREVCSKYFYDQCPAVAGYGKKAHPLSLSSGLHPSAAPCTAYTSGRESGLSVTWLPESSFSENLPKQFPTPCQATSINTPPIPSPPGSRYPACGVGLPAPEHERTGPAPWGMCSSSFHSKPVLCCSGQPL